VAVEWLTGGYYGIITPTTLRTTADRTACRSPWMPSLLAR
jgi:hypothetical protein